MAGCMPQTADAHDKLRSIITESPLNHISSYGDILLSPAGVTAAAESYSDKGVAPPDQGHHFLHIDDFSTDELRAMLASAAKVGITVPWFIIEFIAMDPHSHAESVQVRACNTAVRLHPQVKEKFRQRDESFKPFAGKTMAMIFTKPSMRTRISFETVSVQDSCACQHGSRRLDAKVPSGTTNDVEAVLEHEQHEP